MNKRNGKKKNVGFTQEQIEEFMKDFECCYTSYEVYEFCNHYGWKDEKGKELNTIIDSIEFHSRHKTAYNNSIFSKGKDKQRIKLGLYLPVGNLPDNGMSFIAYTDGSCDNMSINKAGGSGYIILKDGEIFKMKGKGFLNTTNNRMEMLAIISACNSVPEGASIDIYSDSQYAISTFIRGGKKNKDLIELFQKCVKHIKHIRFHWVKGHNGDKYNEMADYLAFSAYREICEEYKIPIGKSMYKTHLTDCTTIQRTNL